jgi:hypothetical protein
MLLTHLRQTRKYDMLADIEGVCLAWINHPRATAGRGTAVAYSHSGIEAVMTTKEWNHAKYMALLAQNYRK